MVARLVRDQEAMGSNPVTSTIAAAPFCVATEKKRKDGVSFSIAPYMLAALSSSDRTVRNSIALHCVPLTSLRSDEFRHFDHKKGCTDVPPFLILNPCKIWCEMVY